MLFVFVVFAFIGLRQVDSAKERRLRLLAGFADRVETTLPDLADRFGRIVTQRDEDEVASYLALVPNVDLLDVPVAAWDGRERPETNGAQSDDQAPPPIELATEGPHVFLKYRPSAETGAAEGPPEIAPEGVLAASVRD